MSEGGLRNAANGLALRLRRFRPLRANLQLVIGEDVRVKGRVWLPGSGAVRIGDGVRFDGRRTAIELHAHGGGVIILEDGVVIEDGASIEATSCVRIGARAHLGAFCKIIDNHFHSVTGSRVGRPEPVPVAVGADAVVGPRAVLLPGAWMGDGACLGSASVLSFRLPAGAVFPGALHA